MQQQHGFQQPVAQHQQVFQQPGLNQQPVVQQVVPPAATAVVIGGAPDLFDTQQRKLYYTSWILPLW